MSTKKLMLLIGLCVLFAGCSTGRLGGMQMGLTNSSKDMGIRYLLGRGVHQDNAKAFYYFNKAAMTDDDPFAQNELGYMYAAGKGTPRDYEKSLMFYQKAADHDLASAQYSLGLMYWYGLGTPVNKTLAMKWIKKSAVHGFEPAKAMLAKHSA